MKRYSGDYIHDGSDYEYTKEWYECLWEFPRLKKTAALFMAELAVLTALFVAALLVNNTGSRVFWVLMPCVTGCFPLYYAWYGVLTLHSFCRRQLKKNYERTDGKGGKVIIPPEHREHMLRSEYEQSVRRCVRSGMFLCVLALLTVVSDVFFMVKAGESLLFGREILFLVINLLILTISVIFTLQVRKIRQDVIKKV